MAISKAEGLRRRIKALKDAQEVNNLVGAITGYSDNPDYAFVSLFSSLLYAGRLVMIVGRGKTSSTQWVMIDIFSNFQESSRVGRWRISHYSDRKQFIISEVLKTDIPYGEASLIRMEDVSYMDMRLRKVREQEQWSNKMDQQREENASRFHSLEFDIIQDYTDEEGDF